MNAIESLEKAIKRQFPGANTSLDPAARPLGPWFLDIDLEGRAVTVEWLEGQGFGVSSKHSSGYGEGPDEVLHDLPAAQHRIKSLLLGRTAPSIRLLVLRTAQLETVKEFYRSLGITFVAERHGDGPLHYAGRLGEAILELYPTASGTPSSDSLTRIGITVHDLAAKLDKLVASGGKLVSPPRATEWGLRAVRDPDERAIEVYEG